jgi:hypothetical protein
MIVPIGTSELSRGSEIGPSGPVDNCAASISIRRRVARTSAITMARTSACCLGQPEISPLRWRDQEFFELGQW